MKENNTDKRVERRDTLTWKRIRNELFFLWVLSFLKRTFFTSSYWQGHKLREYSLFCITKSCKGGQGRNSKYILKIWSQSHVETHENTQQRRVNKDEIYTRFVSYIFCIFLTSVHPHRKATTSLPRPGDQKNCICSSNPSALTMGHCSLYRLSNSSWLNLHYLNSE